ncbi:MAG: AMP-binding protein [Proteobacteria bacterium]|nr:AMP-binding protein [Pseudomonadota bacterium]
MVTYRKAGVHSKRDAAHFHSIEAAEPADLARLQEERLLEQLHYLRDNSPFYQAKFLEAGLQFGDIRGIADLARIPFTLKQELRDSLQASPPFGLHQAAPLADIIQMQASSGTTGSPSYVALTEADAQTWQESQARGLFACGVRPGDFTLHAFSMSKGFVGGVPVFQALQYMGAIDIPIGADGGVERLLMACENLKPRVVIGAPNFLIYLAEAAQAIRRHPATDFGVARLVVGGEPGGGIPAIREKLSALWGAKVCELMGGTDLGCIFWGECDHQLGMHMVAPDYVLVELIDPESGAVLKMEQGARGELVYTALGRQASPLLRFRSGDHVVVTGTACPCGRTGPMIRCFGRTDDMLIVRGINVFPSAIQDIVGSMQPETAGVMRVLADFEGHTTQQNLKVYVERGPACAPAAASDLKAKVEARIRSALAVKVDAHIVAPDSFEKPGAAKVALVLRQRPDLKSESGDS